MTRWRDLCRVMASMSSTDHVVAALDGTVTVFSSCSIRVTSPSGWATNYYHLMNIAVANGAQVTNQAYMWLERGNVRYYASQDQITTPPPGPTCMRFLLNPPTEGCWAPASMRSSHPGAIAWTSLLQNK